MLLGAPGIATRSKDATNCRGLVQHLSPNRTLQIVSIGLAALRFQAGTKSLSYAWFGCLLPPRFL